MTATLSDISAGFAERQQVSLCMIVKNEAVRLGRCLASALPWVAEAIVVDTGSSDGTVALARSMGPKVRVSHFAWCNDFAQARNHALDEATLRWALVLDADEVLAVDDATAWERALEQRDVGAFSIDCHDRLDDGGVAIGPILRLFRRDLPGMRYRGEVHEQVAAVADRSCVTAHASFLHIDHDGHTGAVMREHRTVERNLALARSMVASRPEDPFAWFCLGQSLEAAEAPPWRCAEVYEKALSLFDTLGPGQRDESYLAALWINLTRVVARGGDRAKAERLSALAILDFPSAPDLRFLRGKLLAEDGKVEEAAAEFEACLTSEAQRFFVRQDPGAASFAAETQLGLCRLKMGRVADAELNLRRAMTSAPAAYLLPRLALGMLLLARQEAAEAEAIFRTAVELRPNNSDARLHWARSLLATGRRAHAEEALAPLRSDPRAARILSAG